MDRGVGKEGATVSGLEAPVTVHSTLSLDKPLDFYTGGLQTEKEFLVAL